MAEADEGIRIFDGARLRLTHFARGHDKLLVSFDSREIGRTGFKPPNMINVYDRRGYDQISVRTSVNDWFINAETTAAERVLEAVAKPYRDVAAVGFSMGAYGALRFARAIGATRVLSVSPQWSIHPDDVPFDKRYRAEAGNYDQRLGALEPRAVPTLKGIIAVDPMNRLDLWHAERLQMIFPALRIARLTFGGHPATQVITRGGRYGATVRALLSDPPDPTVLTKMHRELRRDVPFYLDRLSQRGKDRFPEAAAWAKQRLASLQA
ncbi:hypothetical protein B9057_10905 [Aestuarium zhoushanense]|nr:hypothetical protein B9057_10905 [Aestuarium zhoushanense]